MANMDYDKMARILVRCGEIGTASDMKAIVKTTYSGVLQPKAEAFVLAYRLAVKAESTWATEGFEAQLAIASFDKPFREARSVVMAFVPTVIVPATLKQLNTDTDRLQAIKDLVSIVDEHKGLAWADELLGGDFGQNAEATKSEMLGAISASSALDKARKARATTFDPAYEAYLRFKRVVKDALGATSTEYKRIHVRAPAANEIEAEPPSVPT